MWKSWHKCVTTCIKNTVLWKNQQFPPPPIHASILRKNLDHFTFSHVQSKGNCFSSLQNPPRNWSCLLTPTSPTQSNSPSFWAPTPSSSLLTNFLASAITPLQSILQSAGRRIFYKQVKSHNSLLRASSVFLPHLNTIQSVHHTLQGCGLPQSVLPF